MYIYIYKHIHIYIARECCTPILVNVRAPQCVAPWHSSAAGFIDGAIVFAATAAFLSLFSPFLAYSTIPITPGKSFIIYS